MPATMTERQRILIETAAARDKAEAMLRTLLDAKEQSEQNLAQARQPDVMKEVTGRSSMDNAIASTQRMIDSLNRALDQIKRHLSDDDLALLDER